MTKTPITTHIACGLIVALMCTCFGAVLYHGHTVNENPVVQRITAEAMHDVETGKLARPTLWGK